MTKREKESIVRSVHLSLRLAGVWVDEDELRSVLDEVMKESLIEIDGTEANGED